MTDNFKALLLLYTKPAAAQSLILDRGRVWFAIAAALAVSLALHWNDVAERGAATALLRFISYTPGGYLAGVLLAVIVAAPAILLIRALAGYGSFTALMSAEYAPLLLATLMSWAAAYLPLAAARIFVPDLRIPALYLASSIYFAVLLAFGVRAIFGSGYAGALGATAAAWIAGIAGAALLDVVGPVLGYLASPFVLYYLYILFGSEVRGVGQGLRSRQHFKQQLEISTRNPHDADAQYQLGLIYQVRHQYTEAAARFARAVEIDPAFAEARMQLGAIARQQGRFEDAIRELAAAARLDDKLSQNEVWRELGAAYLAADRLDEAARALEKYTARREYDPEGLYWYGLALKRLGRPEARAMFDRAIDAVRTMPPHRRAQVRKWGMKARAER